MADAGDRGIRGVESGGVGVFLCVAGEVAGDICIALRKVGRRSADGYSNVSFQGALDVLSLTKHARDGFIDRFVWAYERYAHCELYCDLPCWPSASVKSPQLPYPSPQSC